MDGAHVLSIRAAAREYNFSRGTIREAIAANELRAYRPTARTVRVFRSDMERWIRRHAVRPTAHAAERVEEVLAREANS